MDKKKETRANYQKYHTFEFLEKRQNDPAWRDQYLQVKAERQRATIKAFIFSFALFAVALLFIFVLYPAFDNAMNKPNNSDDIQELAYSTRESDTSADTSSRTTYARQDTNSQITNDPSTSESNSTYTENPPKVYSELEKQEINEQFLNWAGERAKIAGMAVNSAYFNHGASGIGDWYARTPDGLVQVQQQVKEGKPGYDYFSIHSLGGVVFYYSLADERGKSDEINDQKKLISSTATGFNVIADSDQPIVKYLLGDNGVVYEANSTGAFSDYFYVADNTGDLTALYKPEELKDFIVSKDTAAQEEFKRILGQYPN
ncbi:hypothetical protein ACWOFR_05065 [Carnobacterium gallinarum]|uniref:hypothetical protein n=1 Tax=Carnobacterium gallinarum TaxID=2749 RepID=UPI000689850F|nr:hypothetical protein [Carnobacterium gallinarum]